MPPKLGAAPPCGAPPPKAFAVDGDAVDGAALNFAPDAGAAVVVEALPPNLGAPPGAPDAEKALVAEGAPPNAACWPVAFDEGVLPNAGSDVVGTGAFVPNVVFAGPWRGADPDAAG
jgi:hypothetical protein